MERLPSSETVPETEIKESDEQPTERDWKPSAEARARMSESKKGENNPMYGRRGESHPGYGQERPPAVKAKISRALTGRKPTPETRAKISEKKSGENHPYYDRSIDKIRAAISLHIGGASMRRASREMGFDPNWLSVFRCRNPERFEEIFSEEQAARSERESERALGRTAVESAAGNGQENWRRTITGRLKKLRRGWFNSPRLQPAGRE